ncbi:MAG: LPS export ABC transporter periplasmic protein LptC [Nitrospinae bacterium]|nr:LPS export ABC transporter periplasmic protein LptC [Nitrospinota bacterium]
MADNARIAGFGFHKTMRLLRRATLLLIVALFFGGGYYFFSSASARSVAQSGLTGADGIKTRISGFRLREKYKNDDYWVVDAQSVVLTDARMELENVRGSFLSKENAESSFDLVSKRAVMENVSQDAVFSGGVTVTTSRPMTLVTERLDWNSARRIVSTDQPIVMDVNSVTVNGKDLLLELDKQTLSINSSVEALFD